MSLKKLDLSDQKDEDGNIITVMIPKKLLDNNPNIEIVGKRKIVEDEESSVAMEVN